MTKKNTLKVDLSIGDSAKVLREEFEPNSIDALVTDPPYGLGQEPDPVELLRGWIQEGNHAGKGGGFMGANWDSTVPGPGVWKEVLRVLKPGARGSVFAGTRTLHLMVASLRLAGFSIENVWAWTYGCLDTETEILTSSGWKRYGNFSEGDRVATFNAKDNSYDWNSIQEIVAYEYKDTAYRIVGDHTDQLVSKDHRVLVERNGDWVFQKAQHLPREQEIRVPTLEKVLPLPRYLSSDVSSTGERKINLRGEMCNELSGRQNCTSYNTFQRKKEYGQNKMSRLRERSLEVQMQCKEGEGSRMFTGMQWSSSGGRMETSRTQGEVFLDQGIRRKSQRKNDGFHQPCLEGRSNLQTSQRELQTRKIGPVSPRIQGDEEIERLCPRTSFKSSSNVESATHFQGMCASHGSRQSKQQTIEPCTFQMQPRSQTFRASWETQTSVARVESCQYEGIVWCVRVPNGAFVARRNGKIFVTGNSGFPKSLNVHKSLKKKLKKDGRYGPEGQARCQCCQDDYVYDESLFDPEALPDRNKEQERKLILDDYEDNDLACRVCSWCLLPDDQYVESIKGLGTALKPAFEPIVIVRKPEVPIQLDLPELLTKYGCSEEQIDYIMTPPPAEENSDNE